MSKSITNELSKLKIISLLVIHSLGYSISQAQNSVLSSNSWYKIAVTEPGIYRIDSDFLRDIGINTTSIDPRNIGLFGYGGGMLPQENNASRNQDLPENAIFVSGEGDGQFGNNDFILFYGQTPDLAGYSPEGMLQYSKNLYSDTTFYFIRIGGNPGKRLTTISNEGLDHPRINSFDDFMYHEEDRINMLSTGREWYERALNSISRELEIEFEVDGILPLSTIQLRSAVMAQSFGQSSFDLTINGIQVGNQVIAPIPEGTYDIKGSDHVNVFSIPVSDIPSSESILMLSYKFNPASSGSSTGYFNNVLIEFRRNLKLYNNQTMFRSVESLSNPFSTYEISTGTESIQIWDITDPQNALNQEFDTDGSGKVKFGASSATLREFIILQGSDFQKPIPIGEVPSQNLHGLSIPDGLIVTHPRFISEARRLANFRSSNDNLKVEVVTTEEIYNEFSSGRQDISAIRDFVKYMYRGSSNLRYVLLFGDGSYDYKKRAIVDTNFVPIYEARNSLHPIFSYSSDDYFAILDDDEGFWEESEAGDHLLDIGVGRLPVKTLKEANIVVDKLIDYAIKESSLGSWRNEVVFVADDGDFNIHQRDADNLATFVDQQFPAYNPNKIYLDAFTQVALPNGVETAKGVTDAINEAITQGSLIFNFTGHGNENLWCQEGILNQSIISGWTNRDRMPLFITATCEFGRYDNPDLLSGGELLVLSEKGGAIALLTTSRPVFSNTNFLLNEAFYNNVFKKIDGQFPRLGDIIKGTKNESLRGPVNRGFALLGDPMMILAYPKYNIIITELNGRSLNAEGDTIKAQTLTSIKGEIVDNERILQTSFNGILSATVFDKPTEKTTLGNESNPTIFEERTSAIFRGDVSIVNGKLKLDFVVPKNISYIIKEGKISFYAKSSGLIDANGANIELKIGGSADEVTKDDTPPEMEIYLNDDSFISGDEIGPNPLLIAKFFDDNGINISEIGIGQNISARLDNGDPINLNPFYRAELDNYQRGVLRYPLSELEEGRHSLIIKAFDTHNNGTERTIEFFVTADAKNRISNVINYPNPVSDRTTFLFSHQHISENLKIVIRVFNLKGDIVRILKAEVFDTTGTIDALSWDRTDENGSRVDNGIYLYQIVVQSIDGAIGLAHQKLIVID
ncbi:MAG: type IX secretion system sortase PorU [Bacteroidetes bacterium]|nr:type IX secretion system sortase PorU [Bacteroidota bacterium]MDA1119445.1 type IX secretion system sortase PorU [Bacteroidota bacterium]